MTSDRRQREADVDPEVVAELRAIRSDLVDAEGLRAEREHLLMRLAASEVVEAELVRRSAREEHLRRELAALHREQAGLRRQIDAGQRRLREVRANLERAQRREAKLERRLNVANRRLEEIENSTSLRVGRALVRFARLGRGGAGRTGEEPDGSVAVEPMTAPPLAETPQTSSSEPPASPALEAAAGARTLGPVNERDGVYAPIVMILAVDVAEDLLIESLERLEVWVGERRPLLVTDVDRFDLFRARDLVFEYIPPLVDLETAFASSAEDVRRERLEALRDLHLPVEVHRIVASDEGARLELVADLPPDEAPG